MKFSTTIRLFAAVCVLGVLIWLIEKNQAVEFVPGTTKVLDFKSENVRSIVFERAGFRVKCVKESGEWFIGSPIRAQAGREKIGELLSALENMRKEERITGEQRTERGLKMKDYGLEPPEMRFRIIDDLGVHDILIGHRAPLGNMMYTRLTDSDDVIAASSSILDILPARLEDVRDHAVLRGDASRTTRLEIKMAGKGFIQLSNKDGNWVIHQPIVARADTARVQEMLDVLYSTKVEKFIWDNVIKEDEADVVASVAPGVEAEQRGLAGENASRITVWMAGQTVGKELVLGEKAEEGESIYAKRRDFDSVMLIREDVYKAFSVEVDDIRDRQLFPVKPESVKYIAIKQGDRKLVLERDGTYGWKIDEPVQWKADRQTVEEIVKHITGMKADSFEPAGSRDLKRLGLDPAAMTLEVRDHRPQPEPAPGEKPDGAAPVEETKPVEAAEGFVRQLEIGFIPEPESAKTVLSRFKGESMLMELPSAQVTALGMVPVEPLIYRDRTVMSVPKDNIKSITLKARGSEQHVARNAEGKWTAVKPEGNIVSGDVIEEMLFHTSFLRAKRIVLDKVKNLAYYGLEGSGTVLTFGLSGEEGIQKSLIIGNASGDGFYAMLQGQELIFVMESSAVSQLTQDLSVPPEEVNDEQAPPAGAEQVK